MPPTHQSIQKKFGNRSLTWKDHSNPSDIYRCHTLSIAIDYNRLRFASATGLFAVDTLDPKLSNRYASPLAIPRCYALWDCHL